LLFRAATLNLSNKINYQNPNYNRKKINLLTTSINKENNKLNKI